MQYSTLQRYPKCLPSPCQLRKVHRKHPVWYFLECLPHRGYQEELGSLHCLFIGQRALHMYVFPQGMRLPPHPNHPTWLLLTGSLAQPSGTSSWTLVSSSPMPTTATCETSRHSSLAGPTTSSWSLIRSSDSTGFSTPSSPTTPSTPASPPSS